MDAFQMVPCSLNSAQLLTRALCSNVVHYIWDVYNLAFSLLLLHIHSTWESFLWTSSAPSGRLIVRNVNELCLLLNARDHAPLNVPCSAVCDIV